jgi:hypothetical protein
MIDPDEWKQPVSPGSVGGLLPRPVISLVGCRPSRHALEWAAVVYPPNGSGATGVIVLTLRSSLSLSFVLFATVDPCYEVGQGHESAQGHPCLISASRWTPPSHTVSRRAMELVNA